MQDRPLKVYGIGNAIMDLQLSISDEEFSPLELEKGSMNLVDEAQQQALLAKLSSHQVHTASGGSAANTVIALAELGAKSAYCCLVGNDEFGSKYLSEMQELGILTHVAARPDAVTGSSLILITPDAERTMNTNLGVSAELSPAEVDSSVLKDSEWLYVEGYLFASPTGAQAAAEAIKIAKEHNVKVAITFSDGFIVEVFGDNLRAAVKQADLVFANLNEGQAYTGKQEPQEVFAALASQGAMVALTMSENGALVGTSEQHEHVSAHPVEAVDATGAGDMFAGGFLYGITSGLSTAESGRIACYLGSEVVAQLGPRLKGNLHDLLEGQKLKTA